MELQSKEKLLIIGGTGEIGSFLLRNFIKDQYYCRGTSRYDKGSNEILVYDLNDNIEEKIDINNFSICIITAPSTIYSETDPNSDGLINAIDKLIENGLYIIYISSNQVFSGEKSKYDINDKPCPLTLNGKYKLKVEDHLLNKYKDNFSIVRIPKFLSKTTPFIIEWEKEISCGRQIEVFDNVGFSILKAETFYKNLVKLIKNKEIRLLHWGGHEVISYYEFCKSLFNNDVNALKLIKPVKRQQKYFYASLVNN